MNNNNYSKAVSSVNDSSLNNGMMWNMHGNENREMNWEQGGLPNGNCQNNIQSGSGDNKNTTVDIRSFQEMLLESSGRFLVCRFLIGTGQMVSAAGILKNVGRDYFILEDPCTKTMTTCDLYSVKFVSVLPEEFMPNIPSYCRRRLYENTPIFETGL